MSVNELKALCKTQGLTGYSGKRKADLIDLLSAHAQPAAKTDKKSRMVAATEDTKRREAILAKVLNGVVIGDDEAREFACSKTDLLNLRNTMSPTAFVKEEGGMLKHYDNTIIDNGQSIRGELKHGSTKSTKFDILNWKPWQDGVEFGQGQISSENATAFIDATKLLQEWFNVYIIPFVNTHLPELNAIDFANYYKCIKPPKVPENEKGSLAAKLIEALRSNKVLQQKLRHQWLSFEETYLVNNHPNHVMLGKHIKYLIEQKDVWFCINKSGAYRIEGFNVIGVEFTECVKKPKGGLQFVYAMTLQKKSGGEVKTVPVTFKLYWKNGGQAVQNPNFLLI
jgi:hypothetical protein